MSSPLPDKAEVSIDFPDKFYMGTFGRESRYEVKADEEGVHLHLHRSGDERRHVGFHLHYYLLGDILDELATAIAGLERLPSPQGEKLREAAAKLAAAATGK